MSNNNVFNEFKTLFLSIENLTKKNVHLRNAIEYIYNTWGFAKYVFDIFHLCICLPWEVGYMSKAPKGWGGVYVKGTN